MNPELRLQGSDLSVKEWKEDGSSRWATAKLNDRLANIDGAFRNQPRDRGWFDTCQPRTAELLKRHGCQYILAANLRKVDGSWERAEFDLHDIILSLQARLGFVAATGLYKCLEEMDIGS